MAIMLHPLISLPFAVFVEWFRKLMCYICNRICKIENTEFFKDLSSLSEGPEVVNMQGTFYHSLQACNVVCGRKFLKTYYQKLLFYLVMSFNFTKVKTFSKKLKLLFSFDLMLFI